MGYPSPLKVVTKKISPNVLTVSSPFSILNKLNVGARMVIFHYHGDIIIWSPLPYDKEILENAIAELTTEEYIVKYIFVINIEHNLCAEKYKQIYPNVKLIGPENTARCEINIPLTEDNALKIIKGNDGWGDLGISDDKSIIDNFELIYNNAHKNRELVIYEKNDKLLLLADMIMNLGIHGTTTGEHVLEQYSPELGFPKGFNPHGGWSFLSRYLQPNSVVGKFLMNRLQKTRKTPEKTKKVMELINSWDYTTIIMVHGNLITKEAKRTLSDVHL